MAKGKAKKVFQKKGKVTIVVPVTVEAPEREHLGFLLDNVLDTIANRVKYPARIKTEGCKVKIGAVTFK